VKKLAPMNARTFDQVCSLNRDNTESGDFWMLAGGDEVTISKQREGEACEQSITIDRRDFLKLVSWYMRDQKIKPPRAAQ
jgi:hypothetical protein